MENKTQYQVMEVTGQYGISLRWGRRFNDIEKKEYAEWFRDLGMVSLPDHEIVEIKTTATVRAIEQRKSDGKFCGCENQVYIITQADWDKILDEQKQIVSPKPLPEREYGPGYCYNCKSYCYGDCGNYAPAKTTKHVLANCKEAAAEANFGIMD